MPIKNKRTSSILKVKLKWWILLLIVSITIIWLLPQRTLKIQINTTSDNEQLFYVETRAGRTWNWHSYPSTKLLDKRLISANKVHRIRVSGNLRQWFGDKMYVTVKHPEYRKLMLTEKGYRGKLLTATPQSWLDLLHKEPLLEFSYPELAYQPHDYKDQLVGGGILRTSEISRHISWVALSYHDLKLESLPVLRQLADYIDTRSVGHFDIEESTRDELGKMQFDILTIEEQLEPPAK